jgi:hypothetical protein
MSPGAPPPFRSMPPPPDPPPALAPLVGSALANARHRRLPRSTRRFSPPGQTAGEHWRTPVRCGTREHLPCKCRFGRRFRRKAAFSEATLLSFLLLTCRLSHTQLPPRTTLCAAHRVRRPHVRPSTHSRLRHCSPTHPSLHCQARCQASLGVSPLLSAQRQVQTLTPMGREGTCTHQVPRKVCSSTGGRGGHSSGPCGGTHSLARCCSCCSVGSACCCAA